MNATNSYRVTLGDCSSWRLRVVSFLCLHGLAWLVLLRGQQDVTDKTTIQQESIAVSEFERPKLKFIYRDQGSDGPCFYWINPWTLKEEKIASLWWPEHPINAELEVDRMFSTMQLSCDALIGFIQQPIPTSPIMTDSGKVDWNKQGEKP